MINILFSNRLRIMLFMEKSYINIFDILFKMKRFFYVVIFGNVMLWFGVKFKIIIVKEDYEIF